MTIKINTYADMPELSKTVSVDILSKLAASLTKNGKASLMLSGGSTPQGTYTLLGESNFIWDNVDIAMVDDRWVEQTDTGSNAAMIYKNILSKQNVHSKFYPLKTKSDTLEEGCEVANIKYHKIFRPFTCLILGMGLDGHTASWFPEAEGIQEALNPRSSKIIVPVRPQRSNVTGDYLERATLTLSAVNEAQNIYLLISGQEKLDLFNSVLANADSKLPIRAAIDTLGRRLTVFWSP